MEKQHYIKYSLDGINEGDPIYRCYFHYNERRDIDNLHISFVDDDPDNHLTVLGIVKLKSSQSNFNACILIATLRKKQLCFIPIMKTDNSDKTGIYTVISKGIDNLIHNPRPKPDYVLSGDDEYPFPSEMIVIGKQNAYRLALKEQRKYVEKLKDMEDYLKNCESKENFINTESD